MPAEDADMTEGKPARYPPLGFVLVTGVSSGIGKVIALDLIAAGYTVFGSVRRVGDAASLVERRGRAFHPARV